MSNVKALETMRKLNNKGLCKKCIMHYIGYQESDQT